MITIPNPCSENWNKMNKTQKGRFCESCNHVVVDFTKMTDEKIKTYFEINKSNDVCGKFKKSQVFDSKKEFSFKNKLLKLNFKPLNLILLLMSFFVSSCVMGKQAPIENSQKNNLNDSLSKRSNKKNIINDSLQKKSLNNNYNK